MKKYNGFLLFGGALTALMLLFILLGCFWTPYDTTAMDPAEFICTHQMLPGRALGHGVRVHSGGIVGCPEAAQQNK